MNLATPEYTPGMQRGIHHPTGQPQAQPGAQRIHHSAFNGKKYQLYMKQAFEISTHAQVKRERHELFVCSFVRSLGTGKVAGVQNLQSCDVTHQAWNHWGLNSSVQMNLNNCFTYLYPNLNNKYITKRISCRKTFKGLLKFKTKAKGRKQPPVPLQN